MAMNVGKLIETIEAQIQDLVQERRPGYRVRLSKAIEQLLRAERAWRRDRTPVNPVFTEECKKVGAYLLADGQDDVRI